LEHQKLRKKIRNFSLKTREIKKKNKKKSGSNDENLRKLEPQQKQRVLIKKKECNSNFSQISKSSLKSSQALSNFSNPM